MEPLPLAYRILRPPLRFFIRSYFPLTVTGVEHVPAEGGALIAANHPSFLDGLLLALEVERPIRFLASQNLYEHPLLHPLLAHLRSIPCLRIPGRALEQAEAALREGALVCVFPEGDVVGPLRQLRRGIGVLASQCDVPVVPVGIAGSDEALNVQDVIPRPGHTTMVFRPAIRPHGEDVDVALERVGSEIRMAMNTAEHLRAHPRKLPWLPWLVAAAVVVPLTAVLTLTQRRNAR